MIGWILLGLYLLLFLVVLVSARRAPWRCGSCQGGCIEADGTPCRACVSNENTGH